jgi:hypothetical protein
MTSSSPHDRKEDAVARNPLSLTGYEAHRVIMPARDGDLKTKEAVCIVVFGANFPQRAIEPELLVGKEQASQVSIARDQRSLRGYFSQMPEDSAPVTVRYGDSLEGTLKERFSRQRVRPLPKSCEDLA